jgi:hypothetical protein
VISTGQRSVGAPTVPGVSPRSPVNKQQVHGWIEHLPVKLRERQALPAALAEDFQYRLGVLHYAYLPDWLVYRLCPFALWSGITGRQIGRSSLLRLLW